MRYFYHKPFSSVCTDYFAETANSFNAIFNASEKLDTVQYKQSNCTGWIDVIRKWIYLLNEYISLKYIFLYPYIIDFICKAIDLKSNYRSRSSVKSLNINHNITFFRSQKDTILPWYQ